jgi:MSHA biogenesis protein MshO
MMPRQQGFTLIEMVVAIVVSAIVVGFMSMFMVAPVEAYLGQERRMELADSANNAMRMLESDVRNAVPDSVRVAAVGGNLALELLYAEDVARYRSGAAPQDLTIASDTVFSTLGRLTRLAPGDYLNGYLVIAHALGGDAYTLTNVITPPGTPINIAPEVPGTGEQVITLGPAPVTFALDSPTRSVYFVREPVSYVCNPAAGTLKRFWGYPILANQATHATETQLNALGASSSLIAKDLTACTFNTTAATPYYGGLTRLQMTFARKGETVQVFDQAQVENRP